MFSHCYGLALNLGVSDTIKHPPAMKDCLDTCFEVVKLIKSSPTLCPTRWTVRAESLASIVANYESILQLWETALSSTSNTEMKARIQGVESQMESFKFLFGLILSEMILRHTDKLS